MTQSLTENPVGIDVELHEADLARIATLDTRTRSFFSHRDLVIGQWMAERRLDLRD